MSVQVIMRDGEPEYAVIPWADYKALTAKQQVVDVAPDKPVMLAELKRLREAQGLDIASLAQQVGVSPAYMAMFETGERVPSAPIRRSLAQALKVSGFGDPE